MSQKIEVRCRLKALLEEKGVAPQELARAAGMPLERVRAYLNPDLDQVSLWEAGAMLSALGCSRVAELFDQVVTDGVESPAEDAAPAFEDEWKSPCPESPDGRHSWNKDLEVSDTVYQEFRCQACGRRIFVIL